MNIRRLTVSMLAFCLVAVLVPTTATASAFRIRVEDMTAGGNGVGVVITDQTSGDAMILQEGMLRVMNVSLSADVTLSVSLGITKPSLPVAGGVASQLFLQSFQVTTKNAAKVRLTLEDASYTGGVGQVLGLTNSVGGNFFAPLGSTLTTQAWANSGNYAPELGANQTTSGALSAIGANAGDSTAAQTFSSIGGGNAFSGTEYAQFTAVGPYSLFTQTMMTFLGAGSVSFNQNTVTTVPVPEPGTLLLLGTGILGLARARRRDWVAQVG